MAGRFVDLVETDLFRFRGGRISGTILYAVGAMPAGFKAESWVSDDPRRKDQHRLETIRKRSQLRERLWAKVPGRSMTENTGKFLDQKKAPRKERFEGRAP